MEETPLCDSELACCVDSSCVCVLGVLLCESFFFPQSQPWRSSGHGTLVFSCCRGLTVKCADSADVAAVDCFLKVT